MSHIVLSQYGGSLNKYVKALFSIKVTYCSCSGMLLCMKDSDSASDFTKHFNMNDIQLKDFITFMKSGGTYGPRYGRTSGNTLSAPLSCLSSRLLPPPDSVTGPGPQTLSGALRGTHRNTTNPSVFRNRSITVLVHQILEKI